jgi:hypothetical protein
MKASQFTNKHIMSILHEDAKDRDDEAEMKLMSSM